MPELPEVQTIVNDLIDAGLVNARITTVTIDWPRSIAGMSPQEFIRRLKGARIEDIRRRAKYIIFDLDENNGALLVHLRMTGRLVYAAGDVTPTKHTHIILQLDNGHRLIFTDMRQFGGMWLVPTAALGNLSGYKDLGVEPLDECFTSDFFKKELCRRRTRIKSLLLNQTFIAGLGNIYADEILFEAGIHPCVPAQSIRGRKIHTLYQSIRSILREAIACRGDTVSDYRTAFGESGSYQCNHRVYQRHGESCLRCGATIERMRLAGRSTHYCPNCQR